jgi:hypothetical protein
MLSRFYKMIRSMLSGLLLLGLAGCAMQRPVLYPNEQFKRVGSSAAERDTDECMGRAEEYVASNGRVDGAVKGAATGAATSATINAAAGAAGGAIVGHAGTGAAIGGAAGATRGLIRGLSGKQNPSPVYKNFVNRCLRDKGYDPIGWQ